MAATAEQKLAIAKKFIQTVHIGENQTAKVDSPELQAAAGAIYNAVELNLAALNASLPEPFKSVAVPTQKLLLLQFAVEELVKVS